MSERLSAAELAAETGTDVARIGALTDAGVLVRLPDGMYRSGDVQRVLVAGALGEAGLSLDLLREGIRRGVVSFEPTDRIYGAPGPLSERTVAEVAGELGLSPEVLQRIVTALGLVRPERDGPMRARDEAQVRAFVTAWRGVADDAALLRAARVYGEALHRATEGWMRIYEDAVLAPLPDRPVLWDEMSKRALEPGMAVLAAGREMLTWLFELHLAQELNRLNFESIERQLSLVGVAVPAPRDPAAIVFADLAGYTRLTEEHGDVAAADTATSLASLADEVAVAHEGRLVKLLGDGVMLHFASPSQAVVAACALRDAMAPAGLPPAHIGISAGALIRRESDFFGRTVNVAARLAAAAQSDEVLVTPEVAAAAPDRSFKALPPLELKGIPEPVAALRVVS